MELLRRYVAVEKLARSSLTVLIQLAGFRDYFKKFAAYLETQVGNPEKPDGPNKKYYDPRVWVRAGEVTMIARVKEALSDLSCTQVILRRRGGFVRALMRCLPEGSLKAWTLFVGVCWSLQGRRNVFLAEMSLLGR